MKKRLKTKLIKVAQNDKRTFFNEETKRTGRKKKLQIRQRITSLNDVVNKPLSMFVFEKNILAQQI